MNLTIGGETFRVEVEGEVTKPPLLLSHSLGTDLSMWDGQMKTLTKRFRVIRYDTRGHGGSTTCRGPASMARLGEDALAILDALNVDKAHWLGLSMGGAIGLWLLTHAPSRIGRAILANTAPKLGSPENWNARITSILRDGMDENAASTIDRWFSEAFAEREADRVAAIHSSLRRTSPQGYAACCSALRDMDLREAIGRITNEVLIITGRDDPVVPSEDATAFVSGITGTKHVALDARHMSNIEAEAAFNAAVMAFLTSRPSRTKSASRKAPSAKVTPAKRGGASRRSNAARSPLKKTPAKQAAATTSRSTSKAAPSSTTRRTKAKTSATRREPSKAVAKKPAKTKRLKAGTARRATPRVTAPNPVKKIKSKAKIAKVPAKKATKKSIAKKLPGARRRPSKKPRRPSGRRKS